MLPLLEMFIFIVIVVGLATQVIWPGLTGAALFPAFRLHSQRKKMEEAKLLRDKIAADAEISALLAEIDAGKKKKEKCLNPGNCGAFGDTTICKNCGNEAA